MAETKRKIPIGVDDFGKLRNGGYYYVDKSELVSDIASIGIEGGEVHLFTRPRRFGKTLNLSMLDCFFNIKHEGNTWFENLKVMDHPDVVARMNRYPVVRLNLSGIVTDSFEDFYYDFVSMLSDLYSQFEYLEGCESIPSNDRETYIDTRPRDFEPAEIRDYVMKLCGMLEVYHGVKPIILIDEYDSIINNAFGKRSYTKILSFMKAFFEKTLKKNQSKSFAVVTTMFGKSRQLELTD